ncbi:MAG: putative glycosyltransferase [Bacteroidota bacterium]|jgi:GT2 family glycosyltransferase|nr:putative glycosyltransferase [Bacteroidota bacterium]
MKIAVVILNWNGKKFLQQFLPDVIGFNSADSEIIVADNASTDDSVEYLKKSFPSVRIILNKDNSGFAKGYNDALKEVNAQYYVLLNSDVEVTPMWLEPVIRLMDADSSIAACQPKIKAFHNKELFEYAGAAGGFIDKYGYPFCRGRILEALEADNGQYDDVREIFWATGACMFVRAAHFREVNGFDEDFFAHMEEIDLCWRMKNRGHKVMYCPDSHVYHVGGGTLNKTSPKKTYLNFRNNLILICKNHPKKYFLSKLFIRMVLDGIAGIKFLLSGQFEHFLAILKAHKSFYSTFSKTWNKRKLLQKAIKVYATTGVYRHSIISDFYLRGKRKFSEIDLKERFHK